ncbi:MAG TPA: hypothetical protein VD886_19260 [Herpetosiphonaceae bacterium]|nr:hypothetical protein [Herpetosiphonaceae bacterium]
MRRNWLNRWLVVLLPALAACGQSEQANDSGAETGPASTRTLVSRPTATLPGSGGSAAAPAPTLAGTATTAAGIG